MRVLYLSDNGWAIKRSEVRDDRNQPVDPSLTASCFLAATENGAAIHSTLQVTGVAVTDGEIRAVIGGTAINTQIGPLLTTAEAAGQELDIFDRVVIAGSYSDFERVRVKRTRPAGRP